MTKTEMLGALFGKDASVTRENCFAHSTPGMSIPSSSSDTSKLLAEADAVVGTDPRKAESLYKKVLHAPKCSCYCHPNLQSLQLIGL